MTKEQRLIDANALMNTVEGVNWYHIDKLGYLATGANSQVHDPIYKADDIYNAIENAPTVDAVPVVRCRDCKHFYMGRCSHAANGWLPHREDNDFCSYGEKKGDGNG